MAGRSIGSTKPKRWSKCCHWAAWAMLPYLIGGASAMADELLATKIASNASPVVLNQCYAGLRDTNVGNVNYYLAAAVSLTNYSEKIATAVQFQFQEVDVFGSPLNTVTGNDEGTFSQNIKIEPRTAALTGQVQPQWEWVNLAPAVHTVACSVTRVLFADGSQWSPKP